MSESLEHHDAAKAAEVRLAEQHIGAAGQSLFNRGIAIGLAGLVLSIVFAAISDDGFHRFQFAYLVGFGFVLTLAIGALAFVMLQHTTRAGWSVGVRRLAECMACMMPVVGVMSVPILISVASQNGSLYRWAVKLPPGVERHADAKSEVPTNAGVEIKPGDRTHKPADDAAKAHSNAPHEGYDPVLLHKRPYLNPGFFIIRAIGFFVLWSLLAWWFWKTSTRQDAGGGDALTLRMQHLGPPGLLLLVVTMTFAAFDFFMSLDAHWFSTMFGIYILAGSALSFFAAIIVVTTLLQRNGYLRGIITVHHFHDLGKFLFAFVFFWGYIAFSQYMLIWYASIPEETTWFARRGATTHHADINGWTYVALIILVCHLLIPFAGLLSRHVKRNNKTLFFWSVWLLVMHWVDIWWIVAPEYDGKFHMPWMDISITVCLTGFFAACFSWLLAKQNLVPVRDPRLAQSLSFQNL